MHKIGLAALLTCFLLLIGGGFAVKLVHDRLTSSPTPTLQQRADIKVTIIEGKRREEIAAQLELAGVTTATAFLEASSDVEGKLFPDTYRFFPNTPAAEVVKTLTDTYHKRTLDSPPTADLLTLASIVEREALRDEDRAIIAGVYQNRLAVDMFLGADPSVHYAKDTATWLATGKPLGFAFWGEITQADYRAVVSPYNTYLNKGLPPGPLCNPGLKSMRAAASPARHDYYYFLYDGDELKLAKTLEQHNRNAAAAR
jgi:UPF0755 protein